GGRPTRTAVERGTRIEVTYLGIERRDVGARNVGRVRHHEIAASAKRCTEVARHEGGSRAEAETLRVATRNRERLRRLVGADAETVRQLGQEPQHDRARTRAH